MSSVQAFQADGLAVRLASADTGLTEAELTAATGVAYAQAQTGGTVLTGAVTVGLSEIGVDFGPGALAAGIYNVQVRLTIAGRPRTVGAFLATVNASLTT